mgnify:FL=1
MRGRMSQCSNKTECFHADATRCEECNDTGTIEVDYGAGEVETKKCLCQEINCDEEHDRVD